MMVMMMCDVQLNHKNLGVAVLPKLLYKLSVFFQAGKTVLEVFYLAFKVFHLLSCCN